MLMSVELWILMSAVCRSPGVLPADNRVPWRGDSGLSDYLTGGAEGIPLLGGYYDAGTLRKSTLEQQPVTRIPVCNAGTFGCIQEFCPANAGTSFVKYSYPIATTTALLSWGLLSFPQARFFECISAGLHADQLPAQSEPWAPLPLLANQKMSKYLCRAASPASNFCLSLVVDEYTAHAYPLQGYEQSNQTAYAKAAIKWGADYLMTAHYERGSFVAQVGDPTIDGALP